MDGIDDAVNLNARRVLSFLRFVAIEIAGAVDFHPLKSERFDQLEFLLHRAFDADHPELHRFFELRAFFLSDSPRRAEPCQRRGGSDSGSRQKIATIDDVRHGGLRMRTDDCVTTRPDYAKQRSAGQSIDKLSRSLRASGTLTALVLDSRARMLQCALTLPANNLSRVAIPMKVLVVGQGGREHALVWKLSQSPSVTRVYCAPGNAGTALDGENVDISATDTDRLVKFAKAESAGLTVIGPEVPLVGGSVDAF